MIASIHEYKKLCETVSELKTKYEDNLKDIRLIKKNFIKKLEKTK